MEKLSKSGSKERSRIIERKVKDKDSGESKSEKGWEGEGLKAREKRKEAKYSSLLSYFRSSINFLIFCYEVIDAMGWCLGCGT